MMLFALLQLESVRSPSGLETLRSACCDPPPQTIQTVTHTARLTASRRRLHWTPWQQRSSSPTAVPTSVCCCSRWRPAWHSLSTRRPGSVISWREWLMMNRRWTQRSSSTGKLTVCLCCCNSSTDNSVLLRALSVLSCVQPVKTWEIQTLDQLKSIDLVNQVQVEQGEIKIFLKKYTGI